MAIKLLELIHVENGCEVYRAVDESTNAPILQKIVNLTVKKDPEERQRVEIQGENLKENIRRVREFSGHRNIVTLLNEEFISGNLMKCPRVIINMEFLTGTILHELAVKMMTPISVGVIRRFTGQIRDGLEHLQRETSFKFIHGDINGNHVFVCGPLPEDLTKTTNEQLMTAQVKIIGLVNLTFLNHGATYVGGLTNRQRSRATHKAPETIPDHQPIIMSRRADIWSLGCTVIEMASRGYISNFISHNGDPVNVRGKTDREIEDILVAGGSPDYSHLEALDPNPQDAVNQDGNMHGFVQSCLVRVENRPYARDLRNHRFVMGHTQI